MLKTPRKAASLRSVSILALEITPARSSELQTPAAPADILRPEPRSKIKTMAFIGRRRRLFKETRSIYDGFPQKKTVNSSSVSVAPQRETPEARAVGAWSVGMMAAVLTASQYIKNPIRAIRLPPSPYYSSQIATRLQFIWCLLQFDLLRGR